MESTQARLFNGRDVNKDVLAPAARRLNKPIAFGRVEPLHCTFGHPQTPMLTRSYRKRLRERRAHSADRDDARKFRHFA